MLLLSVRSSVLCEAAGVGRKTPGSSVGVVQPRPDVCPAPAGGLPRARHSCSVGPRRVGRRGHPLSLRGGFQVSSVVVGHSSSLPNAPPSAASDAPPSVIQSHDSVFYCILYALVLHSHGYLITTRLYFLIPPHSVHGSGVHDGRDVDVARAHRWRPGWRRCVCAVE